jgi:hypothetical protein
MIHADHSPKSASRPAADLGARRRARPGDHARVVASRAPARLVAAAGALATFKDDVALGERIREAAAKHDDKTRREIDALLA